MFWCGKNGKANWKKLWPLFLAPPGLLCLGEEPQGVSAPNTGALAARMHWSLSVKLASCVIYLETFLAQWWCGSASWAQQLPKACFINENFEEAYLVTQCRIAVRVLKNVFKQAFLSFRRTASAGAVGEALLLWSKMVLIIPIAVFTSQFYWVAWQTWKC